MVLALLKLIGRPLFRVLFTVEYHGLEHVPAKGAVILAGNHPSYLDPLLITLPINRVIRFMAWDALFKVPLLGWLIRQLGAFPVDVRKGKGEAAYREALRVLENHDALGIFPEGQRSDHGPMGELRAGVARLAIASGAPIVPITIGGAFRAWPKWRLLPKPAKVIVRFHPPVTLTETERATQGADRAFQRQVMEQVAERINRSLTPALRGDRALEKWYQQPPSHIRSYEWAPLLAAIVTTVVAREQQLPAAHWMGIWLPVGIYYLYLIADLALIRPARLAKWLRNSMPIWLILVWHYPLVRALDVPAGEMNELLVGAVLAAFFPFFWADYYTLQKFIRGLVVTYYFSLALLLKWPHPLGVLVATLGFIALFSLWHRTLYSLATAAVMLLLLAVAVLLSNLAQWSLLLFGGLALATLGYLQTFISVAYDIRKAGNVSVQHSRRVAR